MNENQMTIKDLFLMMEHNPEKMEVNKFIDVSNLGYEVKSFKNGDAVWSLIKSIVKKEATDAYHVPQFGLDVSPMHLFYAKVDESAPHWIEATALIDCDKVELYHESLGWTPATVIWNQDRKIDILDVEIEDTHCYFSNGILSHNTLHGDPSVTPGGKAIPFHASVRIRLGSGAQVKDKAGNIIGIHTTITIKKNKVAAPFRKCEFDIIFGKGIVEDEYIFDECRSHCEASVVEFDWGSGKTATRLKAKISGVGAWKEFLVNDVKTGEVIAEKKFYKSEFGALLRDEKFAPYIHKIIEAALTINPSTEIADVPNSEEESVDG